MISFKQIPFPLARSGSCATARPEEEARETSQVALRGMADWVALCQRCAPLEGPAETGYRPATALALRAVIMLLTARGKP